MSRNNTSKDNAVVKRFIRTCQEHKISNKPFQEELFDHIEDNTQFKRYRKVFNVYIKDINFKPNKKFKTKSPEYLDVGASPASLLIKEPDYSKSFSKY